MNEYCLRPGHGLTKPASIRTFMASGSTMTYGGQTDRTDGSAGGPIWGPYLTFDLLLG